MSAIAEAKQPYTRRLLTVDDYYRMQDAGVAEVWLVDVGNKRLQCFSQPIQQEQAYRVCIQADLEQPVTLSQMPGVRLVLSDLFDDI